MIELCNADDAQGYARDLATDTPSRRWWHLPYDNPLIAKALKTDATEPHAWYALWPFRYLRHVVDGEPVRHLILGAYPAPRVIDGIDPDWLAIKEVIAWEPRTNKAWLPETAWAMGDGRDSRLVGELSETCNTVFSDPRAFFTAWAGERARWIAMRKACAVHETREPCLMPGALIVGDIRRVAWPLLAMPAQIRTIGIDPRRVSRAILDFAKLPVVVGGRV